MAKKADATALDSLATKTELNDGLATKADKSEISDMVTTTALETALEPYAKSADVPSIEGLATNQYVDTELGKKADTTAILIPTDVKLNIPNANPIKPFSFAISIAPCINR